jgi:hypothetical protein
MVRSSAHHLSLAARWPLLILLGLPLMACSDICLLRLERTTITLSPADLHVPPSPGTSTPGPVHQFLDELRQWLLRREG